MEETKLWLRNFKSLSDDDQMTHKPKMTQKLYNELIQIFQNENNELRNSAAKQLFDFNQETFMVFRLSVGHGSSVFMSREEFFRKFIWKDSWKDTRPMTKCTVRFLWSI